MADKHFSITADASQTQAAAREVDRAFMRMARAVQAANKQFNELRKVPILINAIGSSAAAAEKRLYRMAIAAEVAAKRIKKAFGDVEPIFDRDAPDWMKPHPGGGGGGGGRPRPRAGGADEGDFYRNRPLFGKAGAALEQGQAMQNAVMAMLPLVVPAALVAAGKYFSIEANVGAVKTNNTLERAGVSNKGGFFSGARNLAELGGGTTLENQEIMGQLALAGFKDPKQASAFGSLAKDIGAAGGDQQAFLDALFKRGPEMAEALHEVAEGLHINVNQNASVNEVLTALRTNLGGLSMEVENAKEGFPELWRTMKENLAMMGDMAGGSDAVKATTSWMKGEWSEPAGGGPTKAGFITDNIIAKSLESPLGKAFKWTGLGSVVGIANNLSGGKRHEDFEDIKNKGLRNIREGMDSGRLTADAAKAAKDKFLNDLSGNGSYADAWTRAYGRDGSGGAAVNVPAIASTTPIPVESGGDSRPNVNKIVGPTATPSNLGKRSSSRTTTIRIQNDPYSPNRLTGGVNM